MQHAIHTDTLHFYQTLIGLNISHEHREQLLSGLIRLLASANSPHRTAAWKQSANGNRKDMLHAAIVSEQYAEGPLAVIFSSILSVDQREGLQDALLRVVARQAVPELRLVQQMRKTDVEIACYHMLLNGLKKTRR